MSDLYGEAYFRSANYANYLERSDRYRRTAHELAQLLAQLGLLNRGMVILDLGCALGFLLDGFADLGYQAIGVDTSAWARGAAAERGIDVRASVTKADVLIALDVFEHMTDQQVRDAVDSASARSIIARIPVSTDGGRSFHLEVSRNDATHINCKTRDDWVTMLRSLGYPVVMPLRLFTVYDTPGVACLLAVAK